MCKFLGLTPEQVCELGQWKNGSTFSAHYLHLGAADSATKLIDPVLVHTVSSSNQVESEWCFSPGTFGEPGRYDHEGGAREEDEPTSEKKKAKEPTMKLGERKGIGPGVPDLHLQGANCRRSQQ
jgi:hypothetical protein